MFSKTNMISTLVAALWAYVGGYLLWGVLGDPLLADYLGSATGVMREMPDHMHLIIGCVIIALMFCTIYSKWARGHHSASQGVQLGLYMGILAGLGAGLIDFATSNMLTITGTFINALLYIVYYVIMGILVSLIYGKLSSSGE
jgi:hypothetical protein